MGKDLGVAIIGSGRIGTIRAKICSQLPNVSNLVIADLIPEKARKLAEECKHAEWTTDFAEAIKRKDVDAVIISTDESAHLEPTMLSIELGKPTLVEKPLVLSLKEADTILEAAREHKATLFVGHTQRFRRKYASVKETIEKGYLGDPLSFFGRIDLTRAVAKAVSERAPGTTPAINTLTYHIDLALWYLGKKPVKVYAQGCGQAFGEKKDSVSAIVTFEDGSLATFGVNWNIPESYPASVASMDLQMVGTKGTLNVSDRHEDFLLVTQEAFHSPYNPEVAVNVAYLGSAMPGDWALSRFFGPMKTETELFLESAANGTQVPITTGLEARNVLELALAVDKSLAENRIVSLPLS